MKQLASRFELHTWAGGRGYRRLLVAGMLGVILAGRVVLGDEPSPPAHRASELVQALGSDDYEAREQAARELVAIGFPAIEALERGSAGADREVRFRARRVLTLIREVDFQRRLQAFLSDRGGSSGYGLPGWEAYKARAGDSSESRSLFIDMQKQEPDLMRFLSSSPEKVAPHLSERVQAFQQAIQVYGLTLPLGSIAAYLFAAQQPGVSLDNQTANGIYQFCRQDSLRQALEAGSKQSLARKLLSGWIVQAEGWLVPQALMLAHDYELSEGLSLALRSVGDPASQSYERQYALAVIGQFGNEEHVPQVEPLLQDATLCTAFTVNQVTIKVEVRDIALATILKLNELDPVKFGFQEQPFGTSVLHVTSHYFEDDAQRQRAFAAWRERKTK